jgi:hypothetical protein
VPGRDVTLDRGDGPAPVARSGGELARMLAAFRDAALGRAAPVPDPSDGPAAMALVDTMLDALDAAGAPLARGGAPKHAASPSLRVPGAR